MDLISWTPDLAVHVDKIDEQHKELFKRFNQVGDAIWEGKGKEEIGKFLGFMAEYVVVHFRDEEDIMLQNDYPGYSTQKSAHETFTKQMMEIKAKFDNGEADTPLVVKVVEELGSWFKNHIRTLDLALGNFISGKEK